MYVCMNDKFWAQMQRGKNIEKILSWIIMAHKAKKTIVKRKLMNVIMGEIGCSNSKAREYLKVLEGKCSIQIVGEEVKYINQEDIEITKKMEVKKWTE